MSSITIGTSGFSFDDWKGTVYPHHLKKEEWLSYYEGELGFKALEVNFTYYTLPSPRTLEGMARKTSHDFAFVVKAFRGMTHDIYDRGSTTFANNKKTFEQFVISLQPLIDAHKLACVLAQFPYSFQPSEKTYAYLKRCKELLEPLPLVIEFRNRKWLTEKTIQFLREHTLGYCAVDEPRLSQLMPFYPAATSAIGYFRFHGRNTSWFNVPTSVRYDYLYSTAQIKEFIAPLTMIAAKTEQVFAFFNNCHAGSAARNAAMLIRMLQKEKTS
jgi:uncharacterized protein YecE (DUF72 family)